MSNVIRFALVALLVGSVEGRDIRVLSLTAPGLIEMFRELRPEFEHQSGDKLDVTYEIAAELQQRLDRGETFDVIIHSRASIDGFARQGKIQPYSEVDFAKTGIGVCVRKGAPKPDISSVAAFKQTVLNAKSVTFNEAVSSGTYMLRLAEKLGIVKELRAKTVPAENKPGPGKVVGVVARGEAELGFVITTDILSDVGIDYVGPLPIELQSYVVFTGAITQKCNQPERAKALLEFLRTPASIAVIAAKGMQKPD